MSFIAPSLPENAPFSQPQRAWLDGFLAGLLSDREMAAPAEPTMAALAPQPASAPASHEPEDFPWHDPGLALDERLALAAGRPPARRADGGDGAD